MDKVLKQRLIGASILIALAVIFIPMLFDAPDDERGGREMSIELPEPPTDRAQVRRLPLDPDQARRVPPESVADPAPGRPQPAEPESNQDVAAAEDVRASEEPVGEASPMPVEPEVGEEIVLLEPEPEPELEPLPEIEPAPEPEPDNDSERTLARPTASDSRAEGWLVQVASFGSETTAREIVERLHGLGHVATIDPLVRGDMTLYRVVTGPYPERADAERARGQIVRTVAGVEPVVRAGSVPVVTNGVATEQYAVQLGSFASRNNADRLISQLAADDFPAFMHEDASGGRTIWRVRLGPYGSREEAERTLALITERAGLEGLVVSHP